MFSSSLNIPSKDVQLAELKIVFITLVFTAPERCPGKKLQQVPCKTGQISYKADFPTACFAVQQPMLGSAIYPLSPDIPQPRGKRPLPPTNPSQTSLYEEEPKCFAKLRLGLAQCAQICMPHVLLRKEV